MIVFSDLINHGCRPPLELKKGPQLVRRPGLYQIERTSQGILSIRYGSMKNVIHWIFGGDNGYCQEATLQRRIKNSNGIASDLVTLANRAYSRMVC